MIEFKGLSEIVERLNDLSNMRVMVDKMGDCCAAVEASAKEKCPAKTSNLRRSIESKIEVEDGVLIGTVFTTEEYAPYVEYGTGKFAVKGGRTDLPWRYQDEEGNWHTTNGQHPQPFMRPALDENREDIINYLREGLTSND